jgi:hypothetical protein
MNKRFRYLMSSLVSALGFAFFVSLPYESRYFGLMAGEVLVIFCVWFGLGILFEGSVYTRIMSILLPVTFLGGFGMFGSLLANGWMSVGLMSLFFGMIIYIMFLVENVFLVAIGFKTVPLYRAAYTVSLILLLISSFFMYDSLFSFRSNYLVNTIVSFLIGCLIFLYQFWAVAIELPDDGITLGIKPYVFAPALLLAELTLVLSYWPTGIFKGSVYLVSAIYIFCGLIQANIRDRLFVKVKTTYFWIGIAVVAAILMVTKWS